MRHRPGFRVSVSDGGARAAGKADDQEGQQRGAHCRGNGCQPEIAAGKRPAEARQNAGLRQARKVQLHARAGGDVAALPRLVDLVADSYGRTGGETADFHACPFLRE